MPLKESLENFHEGNSGRTRCLHKDIIGWPPESRRCAGASQRPQTLRGRPTFATRSQSCVLHVTVAWPSLRNNGVVLLGRPGVEPHRQSSPVDPPTNSG